MPSAIIIGAGPAGCTAAILLARAGWQVDLLEQHRFPRDKVCGECLSTLGIETLERLNLLSALRPAGAIELRKASVFAPNGATFSVKLPAPMLGISRMTFDALLLEAARQAGAAVRQPARFEGAAATRSARIRCLITNHTVEVNGHLILLAHGKPSSADSRHSATRDFGIKAHFERVDVPRDAISLYGVAGSYGGVAPIERNRFNVAFSVPRQRLAACAGDLDQLFAQLTRENEALAASMRRARRAGSWLGAPLPRYPIDSNWPPNVIPIGNAAAAIEPIGGEGIGLAMRSAELCADALIRAARDNSTFDPVALRARFTTLWRWRRLACRATAVALSSPRLAKFTIPMLQGLDLPLEPLMRAIGKCG